MPYSYVVGDIGFGWKGHRLTRGAALEGDDARELESPENHHLLLRCVRIEHERISDAPFVPAAGESTK